MRAIDVIIPVYNNPQLLERTLVGFCSQRSANFRIIIADDGSNSDTASLVKDFDKKTKLYITHCRQEDKGFRKARILNKAMKLSKAPQVIFTDQDCIPHPDFVEEHARRFVPNGILVGGYLRLPQDYCQDLTTEKVEAFDYVKQLTMQRRKTLMWKHLKHTFYIFNPLRTRRPSIAGANFSVCRRAFLHINGFDNNYEGWGQEDSDLAMRLWLAKAPFRSFWHLCLTFHQWHPIHQTKKEKRNRTYYKRQDMSTVCKNGFQETPFPIVVFKS